MQADSDVEAKRPKIDGEIAFSTRSDSNGPTADHTEPYTDGANQQERSSAGMFAQSNVPESSKEVLITSWRSSLQHSPLTPKDPPADASPDGTARRNLPHKSDSSGSMSHRIDSTSSRKKPFELRGITYKASSANMGFQSGPSRNPYQMDYSSWRSENNSVPSLTRDNTTRTSETPESELDGTPRRSPLSHPQRSVDGGKDPKNNSTRRLSKTVDSNRSMDHLKTRHALSNAASVGLNPVQVPNAQSSQTDSQSQLPRMESLDSELPQMTDPGQSSVRSMNYNSAYDSPASQYGEHLKRLMTRSSQQKDYGRREAMPRKRDNEQPQRAAMGIQSLLQASEQLADGTGSSARASTPPNEVEKEE